MIIDKHSLTCFSKPYKASTGSNSIVVTLAKLFTDKLAIDINTDLIISLDEEKQEISIRKVKPEDLRRM